MMKPLSGTLTILFVIAVGAAPVFASGFEIEEQDAKGLGTAYAGRAAAVENAAALYWNPGAISKLKGGWVTFGFSVPIVTAELTDLGSTDPFGQATGGTGSPVSPPPESQKDGGGAAVLPHAYITYQFNPHWTAGVGFNVPFALSTDYGNTWFGRYHATNSEVQVLNVPLGFAWAPNEQWSFGGTINFQHADATLENMVNGGAQGGAATSQLGDIAAKISGDSFAVGFTVGALFEWKPGQRVGLSYRSKVTHDLEGDANFSSQAIPNSAVSAELNLPQKLTLSSYNEIDEDWAIVGDVTWTGWSDFKEIRIKFNDGRPDAVTPASWDDVWRAAIGVLYKVEEKWRFRLGFAWDGSPVPNSTRGPRIPDNDRLWVTLGTTYYASEAWEIDFGFLWLIASSAGINQTAGGGAGTILAESDLGAIGVSLTASFKF